MAVCDGQVTRQRGQATAPGEDIKLHVAVAMGHLSAGELSIYHQLTWGEESPSMMWVSFVLSAEGLTVKTDRFCLKT